MSFVARQRLFLLFLLLSSPPSYTHRRFCRGRLAGRACGARSRIPTNSFVWGNSPNDSLPPRPAPQNGRARQHDQVPPELTLQRNLPYSATHPAPQRTLQRTLRPNLPYSETYPTPHPAAKLTLHRNAPCSAPCDQTYPTAPYLTNLRRYSPPLSSYYLYSYKLYYAFCPIVHFISSVNF